MPPTSGTLAKNSSQGPQNSDWIPASIISHDFTSAERRDYDARSLLDRHNVHDAVTLTALGGCLQSSGLLILSQLFYILAPTALTGWCSS